METLSKAQKTIERVNGILDKAIDSLKAEYHEAEGSYRDTGWDRYYTKMERLEKEIEELKKYRQVEAKNSGRQRRHWTNSGRSRRFSSRSWTRLPRDTRARNCS